MTTLQTERLVLRPFVMEDLAAFHAIVSHPDVWRFDPGREPTLEETREVLAYRIGEMKRHGIGRWAVVERATAALVGYCGLQLCLIEEPRGNVPAVELFYGLARERWGEGLVTEAATALVGHGFGELRLPRIVSSIQRANVRSIGVARRVGMTIEDDPMYPDFVLGVIRNPALAGEAG